MNLAGNKYFRLKLAALYALMFLFVFAAARAALYIAAGAFFRDVTLGSFLCALFSGMRFDMFAVSTFCGVFLFLINIPADSKLFIKINCAALNVLFLVFSFVLAADIVYFRLFEKHLTKIGRAHV